MDFSPEAPYRPNEEEENLLRVDMDSLTPKQKAEVAMIVSANPGTNPVEAARMVLAKEKAEEIQRQESK